MRNTDERLAAVRDRVAALDRQSRRRRGRWIAVTSVAACLGAIVTLSFYMPGWVEKSVYTESGGMARAASLFAENGALGYLVIGILAFILGVSVTVLCFRLRRLVQNKEESFCDSFMSENSTELSDATISQKAGNRRKDETP